LDFRNPLCTQENFSEHENTEEQDDQHPNHNVTVIRNCFSGAMSSLTIIVTWQGLEAKQGVGLLCNIRHGFFVGDTNGRIFEYMQLLDA